MSNGPKKYDAAVIGAGPGGYPTAIRLAQLGKKTVIIDKKADFVGGVCLNWGCIPSKALIKAGSTFHKLQSGELADLGIVVEGSVRFDPKKLQAFKKSVLDKLRGGIRTLLKSNKIDFVEGAAKLVGPKRIEVEGAGIIEADAIVLATGSRPIELPFLKFDDRVIDSTGALALDAVPRRLAVIGGGVIGLEIGQFYQNVGSQLTVIELLPQLLPGTDPDLVRVVERVLKARGAKVHLEAKAKGAARQADGSVGLTIEKKDGTEEVVAADYVLVCVGRRPNSENLGLEALGVKIERGFIQVDERQRTAAPSVYAIGDVTPGPQLAHKATKEGMIAAEVIAGRPTVRDWRCMPGAIFTDPEIATVGLTETEAKAAGRKVKVGKFMFAAIGRALAANESDGFAKVIADPDDDTLLGVGVAGAHASDLISEAALAIEMGAAAEDLALTIHPHPTLPEAIMEAAEAVHGRAIHAVARK